MSERKAVTIITDESAEEVHPLTPAAIQRSADHRYQYQGRWYPGVTGILGMLDKSGPLMSWAARQTAEAALGLVYGDPPQEPADARLLLQVLDSVGREGFIKAVTSRAAWQRDEAASLGTKVHEWAELVVRDGAIPELGDPIRKRVMAYAEWWKASGWRLRLSEAMVVDPATGYGGTFDLLAYDRDGRTVLADIKTGKGIYREAILQLAAYSYAPLVAPAGSPEAYPMPTIDRHVILHVTTSGVREVELSVGDLEYRAFLACITLSEWADTVKGKL